MVLISTSVKDDLFDATGLGPTGQNFTYDSGLISLLQTGNPLSNFLVQSRCRGQSVTFGVVDYLSIDMLQAAKDGNPGAILADPYLLADAQMSTTASRLPVSHAAHSLLLLALLPLLQEGVNVIAVEVHQANGTSSDMSFNYELTGVGNETYASTKGKQPILTVIKGEKEIASGQFKYG